MEKVIVNGVECEIEYRETKIGSTVYDKNSGTTYIATIEDADDINWIVVKWLDAVETPKTFEAKQITAIIDAFENVQVQVDGEWYYMSYTDLTKLIQKSKAKFKVEQKRKRTWAIPTK
jgi:hypothetical protein